MDQSVTSMTTSVHTIDQDDPFDSQLVQSTNQYQEDTLTLIRQSSFDLTSIDDWSDLQEQLQLQYGTLSKETEVRNGRKYQMNAKLLSYSKTQLRYKDLQRKWIDGNIIPDIEQNIIHSQATKLLDCSFIYIQNLFFNFVDDPRFFAQILYYAFQNTEFQQSATPQLDDFIYNFVNHICDPVVGAGLAFGMCVLREMIEIDLKNFTRHQDFFEVQGIATRLLDGFLRRPECHVYIQQVLKKPIKLLSNLKDSLETNPKIVYDSLIQKKQQAEAKEIKIQKVNSETKKSILQKLGLQREKLEVSKAPVSMRSSQELLYQQPYQKINQPLDEEDRNIREEKLNIIRQEISINFSINSDSLDEILLEETAQLVYERRTAMDLILKKFLRAIVSSMNRIPFVVRVIAKLLKQMFYLFKSLTPNQIFWVLSQFILNRWFLNEFPFLLKKSCTKNLHNLISINEKILSKKIQAVWKGDLIIEGFGYLDAEKFFSDLIDLSQVQLKQYFGSEYVDPEDQRQYNLFLLSLSDLQIIINMVSKSKLDMQDDKHKIQFNNLKKTAQNIQKLSQDSTIDFMKPYINHLGMYVQSKNLFFTLSKISDIFNINYLDSTFKFVDVVKIKLKPKPVQEDLLFIGKCKQVWVQFMLSIEKISQMSKLRHDVVFTFDNLIYMYKDSYEDKGINIKQYENISAHLYANYLISIFKVIPPNYKANNLSLLCREIKDEFNERLILTQKQLSIFLNMFQELMTSLNLNINNLKQQNKKLKSSILKINITNFFKSTPLPLRFAIRNSQLKLENAQGDKVRNAEQILSFLTTTNGDDIDKMIAEIFLTDMRDFVELFSQMSFLRGAIIEGNQKLIEAIGITFSWFMEICDKRLQDEEFYKRLSAGSQWEYHQSLQQLDYPQKILQETEIKRHDWELKRQRRFQVQQGLAYELLERLITKRILSKFHHINTYQSHQDEIFHKKCLEQQSQPLSWHGMESLDMELEILAVMAEKFRLIDEQINPLEKLQCVALVLDQILQLLQISGEGSKNDSEDRIKPIFIYIIIKAAPKRMITSLNIIKALLNNTHWEKSATDFRKMQLVSAIQFIEDIKENQIL